MRSQIIPVLERRRFEYTYLGAAGQQLVTICPAIEVADFYHVQLWVRIHARSFSSDQIIGLSLFNTLPSDDEPREFTALSSAFASLSFSGSSPSSVPGLVSVSATGPGPFLKLVLSAFQATSVAGTFYTELSAVLLVRPS